LRCVPRAPRSTLSPYTTLFRSEMRRATPDLERALREIACFQDSSGVDHANDDVDGMFFKAFEFSKVCNRNKPSIGIERVEALPLDRKSTRLNSSHQIISYAVFC